jgi:TP901 family phage tail tape measure protein
MAQKVTIQLITNIEKSLADVKKLQAGTEKQLEKINNRLKKTNTTAKQTSKTMSALGNQFRQLGSGLLAFAGATAVLNFFREGAAGAREFSKAIAEVNSILPDNQRLTEDTIETFREYAELYGIESQNQARGFYEIVSAGIKGTAEQTRFLNESNKAAAAGLTNVGESARALTSITNAYATTNLKVEEASDVLFKTIQLGQTTFSQLAPVIGRVTAVAAASGISFNEVGGALAFLTKAGLQTDVAVTGLRQVFAGILEPSKQAAEVAELLGIKLSTAGVKAAGGFLPFITDLIKKTGASETALTKLFGNIRAATAVLAIAKGDFQDFTGIMKDLEEPLGATDRAFKKIQESSDDLKIAQLEQKFKNLREEIGDRVNKVMIDLASIFLTLVEKFDRFIGRVGKFLKSLPIIGTTTKKELNIVTAQIDRLKKSFEAGDISESNFNRLTADLIKKQKELQTELDKTTKKIGDTTKSTIKGLKGTGKAGQDEIDKLGDKALTEQEKRAKAVDALLKKFLQGQKNAVKTSKLKEEIEKQLTAGFKSPLTAIFKKLPLPESLKKFPNKLAEALRMQAAGAAAGLLGGVAGGAGGAAALATEGLGLAADALIFPGIGQQLKPVFDLLLKGAEETRKMVREFAQAIPDLVMNLVEAAPALVEELIKQAPRLIERLVQLLPEIITSLAEAMPRVGTALALAMPEVAISFATSLIAEAPRIVAAIAEGIAKAPINVAKGIGGFLGFAEGGSATVKKVPGGFNNDTFPARLTSGELVVDRSTSELLKDFLSREKSGQTSGGAELMEMLSQPIVISIDGREIARATRNQLKAGFVL